MRQQVAGTRMHIGGEEIQCPRAPLFYVKAFGSVIDITTDRVGAHNSFDRSTCAEVELWELDRKHLWRLLRRMSNGHELQKKVLA